MTRQRPEGVGSPQGCCKQTGVSTKATELVKMGPRSAKSLGVATRGEGISRGGQRGDPEPGPKAVWKAPTFQWGREGEELTVVNREKC